MYRYLKGWIRIFLRGAAVERFLNLCSYQGILLWNIVYQEEGCQMNLYAADFRRLLPLVRKTGCMPSILEKHGFPFFIYRRRERKLYMAGFILAAFLVVYLSGFIWNIHIEGNLMYTEDTLLQYLENNGVYTGIKAGKVDCGLIEQQLRDTYPRITWASARVEGTRLLIEIRENYGVLSLEEKDDTPSDIVADEAGTVVSIITRTGIPCVKSGDTVEEGQLLVSGAVPVHSDEGEVLGYQHVQADADVMVQTVMDYEDQVPLIRQVRKYTGRTNKQFFFQIGQVRLTVPLPGTGFELSDAVNETSQAHLFSNFYLPFWWGDTRIREYEMSTVQITKDRAKEIAEKNFQAFLSDLEQKQVKAVENSVRIYYDANVCRLAGTVTTNRLMGKRTQVDEKRLEETQKTDESE